MSTILVYITTPDFNVATKLGEELVTEKIVSCVNILPQMQSIYWWDNKIERATECVLIAKTIVDKFKALEQRVLSLHPYECPCIVALPIIDGHEQFLDWIKNTME